MFGVGLGTDIRKVSGPVYFDPRMLPGLALFLRSDVGVTAVGGLVTNWADQSGNTFDGQAVGAARPSLITGSNGKPSISFPAGTILKLVASANMMLTGIAGCSIAATAKVNSTVGTYQFVFWEAHNADDGNTTNARTMLYQGGGFPQVSATRLDGDAEVVATAQYTNTLVQDYSHYIATIDYRQRAVLMSLEGVTNLSSSVPSGAWTAGGQSDATASHGLYVGAYPNSGGGLFNVDEIQCLIVYNRTLSPAEQALVTWWMNTNFPAKKSQIVVESNSIGLGYQALNPATYSSDGFAYLVWRALNANGDVPLWQFSVNGGATPLLTQQDRLLNQYAMMSPTRKTLVIGFELTNDYQNQYTRLGGNRPAVIAAVAQDYADWYSGWKQAALATGSQLKVIYGSPLPRTGIAPFGLDNPWNTDRAGIDAIIRASGNYDAIADFMASPLVGINGAQFTGYFNADSIHPSETGHAAMAAILSPIVAALW